MLVVVGPLYPFMDGGGDLTCSQGAVGHPWVLVGICCHGLALVWPHCHLSWLSVGHPQTHGHGHCLLLFSAVLGHFAP